MISSGYMAMISRMRQAYLKKRLQELNCKINISDFSVFLSIDTEPNLTCNEILKKFYIQKSTISKSTDKLLKLNYIESNFDSEHRQKIRYHITESGKEVISLLRKISLEWDEKIMNGLSFEEKEIFFKLILKMCKNTK